MLISQDPLKGGSKRKYFNDQCMKNNRSWYDVSYRMLALDQGIWIETCSHIWKKIIIKLTLVVSWDILLQKSKMATP